MTSSKSTVSFFNIFSRNPHDVVTTPVSADNVSNAEETGMDRLRQIFTLDEYGHISREISMITQFAMLSTVGGFIIGGVAKSREAFVSFIENNEATQFSSHRDAKRQLQREVYLSFAKGGYKLGWRVGAFSLTFTSLLTALSVYRNKDSVLAYMGAGAITGGLFKLNMGPKGVVAGSALGGVLGTIAGTLSLVILNVGGLSMTDIKNMSKTIMDARENALRESRKQQMEQEFNSITETDAAAKR